MANNLRVVVAAAGSGTRMGNEINKQFISLGGQPVLTYCIEVLEKSPLVQDIVIVVREQEMELCQREIIDKYGFNKVIAVVAGGAERQDSVWKGLQSLGADTAWVAIQDGARPFLSESLLASLVDAAKIHGAAVPGVILHDTIKSVDQEHFVLQTLKRGTIATIQTPQVFDYQRLWQAYKQARQEGFYATDDAALYEKYCGPVKVVASEASNMKLTHPEDIILAEAILKIRREACK